MPPYTFWLGLSRVHNTKFFSPLIFFDHEQERQTTKLKREPETACENLLTIITTFSVYRDSYCGVT